LKERRRDSRRTEADSRKLAAIVDSSNDAIVTKDLNGIVTSWNPAAERIFGYKAEEMIGRSILQIIPPELQSEEELILGKIRRGERIEHFETIRLTKSGPRLDVSLTISPVKDEHDRVIGASKIARDITPRKKLEEALRVAEKLATTSQMAAMLAHEINNPMQALSNIVSLISNKPELQEETRKLLDMADVQLRRMSHITRQMLSFYRDSKMPVLANPTEIVDSVLELLSARIAGQRIEVERRYEFAGEMKLFPAEFTQLFANLLNNAVEAVDHHGRICIHITRAQEWHGSCRSGVKIVIADNGPGIPADLRSRIFEPFFTTKEDHGTGLGLWIVKGMATKHQGWIRMHCSATPDRCGTVFAVFLPSEVVG